ncbi:MAG TPA: hypothetical protein VGX92_08290 [Pyrinomonadaceae bacterium]|nr:hypothetical protein [Pyrinomonadaceae bacterium]
MRKALAGAGLGLLALLALGACNGNGFAPTQNADSTNQAGASNANVSPRGQGAGVTTAQANQAAPANARDGNTPPVAGSPRSAPQASSGGEPVDTSGYDAQIRQLEAKAKKNPADRQTRLALGKAYTDRGDALTGVRQYRAALGDYRRALRLDPDNAQAQQMAGTIISILKSMGRDVPAEGQEPAPLPLKPE